MKPITTIESVSLAWDVLQKANLHHFIDGGLLYAVQKLADVSINISDIISDLLTHGVLIEFLATITGSPVYIDNDNKQIPWSKIDMAIAGGIISDFFTNSTAVFKALKFL
ncbi:MAG: hypothetical protein Q8M98_05185 [Candidatus Cloacimonadaceae bacterium]|nr:hypothetical protein [Candidatus Cloacimonadaceae bacterium]